MTGEHLLEVDRLQLAFASEDGPVHAVNGVSFHVDPGDVFAVVGESGSGKSATALSIMGLLPDNATVTGGSIRWRGDDLLTAPPERLRAVRGREIAMIFQDPMTALNPVHRVGRQVAEVLRIHEGMSRDAAGRRAIELLELVGIPDPARRANAYPHQFSGGMRQRVMIAIAIACRPQLLIADEPTTALDATVQAQILELLARLKDETGSAIVLITHDFGIVAGMASRVMVMYAGRPVEEGSVDDVLERPSHPYTAGLLRAVATVDDTMPLQPIPGHPPSMLELPAGCAFHPRCDQARADLPCTTTTPELVLAGGRRVACHLHVAEPVAAGDAVPT